jgi:signal transduction histidine kinase
MVDGPAASWGLAVVVSLAWLAFLATLLLIEPHAAPPQRVAPDSSLLMTERMFEQLYRIARQVEVQPQQVPVLLLELLRDLFEPMQAELVPEAPSSTQLSSEGSTMLVPVPLPAEQRDASNGAIRLRFAQGGQRTFTTEDALLSERIGEQIRRAVAFDRAVEQGRSEERLRLAQDLHDDIGARLLTLMYKAQSPEMEEYVRHTLKDLKTLTRGLSAPSHRLSHAAAEWKIDLAQRLTAADVVLDWSLALDGDIQLSVVQWSALTRILRELVSNAIAHAGARQVDVSLSFDGARLELSVGDDGCGRDPGNWSHGLGLGGVRKRVRQLGGDIEWFELHPTGIGCRVRAVLQPSPE